MTRAGTTRRVRPLVRPLAVGAILTATVPVAVSAQVGYPPERSPFVDLEYRQAAGIYGGYYVAATDRAGVAPRSGPLVGARHDLFLGGPAWLTSRVAAVLSERDVIDPARSQGQRTLGTEQRPLFLADVGLSVGLTGQKTVRGVLPILNVGAGVASNFRGADVGGYRFGTQFMLTYGGGLRYVGSGRLSMRADVGGHLYPIRYPDRYFSPGLDSTSVLPTRASKSSWTNNLSITVGAGYQFFR